MSVPAASQPAPAAQTAATATTTTTTTTTTAYDAGFDEDDEFEEFEDEDWAAETTTAGAATSESKELEWADDWDDDLVEGDFVTQLRQELKAKQ